MVELTLGLLSSVSVFLTRNTARVRNTLSAVFHSGNPFYEMILNEVKSSSGFYGNIENELNENNISSGFSKR